MGDNGEKSAKLVVSEGDSAGEEFPLVNHAVFEIGRAQSSTITIPDKGVAMNHCRIYREDGIFTLYDLNTTKGTFINGEKITKQVLGDGDTIQIGPVLLVFWNPDGEAVVKDAAPAKDDAELGELEVPWEDDTSGERKEDKDTSPIPDETVVADLPMIHAPEERGAPATSEAKLTVLEGPNPGTVFTLRGKDAYSIGRASEADVKIMDIKISRHHTKIAKEAGAWYVADRDSRNGTFLNGEQIRKHPLKDGDHIKVGFTIMQFDVVGEPSGVPVQDDLNMETKVAAEYQPALDDMFPDEPPPPSSEPKTAAESHRKPAAAAAPEADAAAQPAPAAPAAPAAHAPGDKLNCDLCGRELLADDLSSGLAVAHQGKNYCLTCVRKLQSLASGAFQPPPAGGGAPGAREDLNDSEIDMLLKEEDDNLFQ